MTDLPYTAGMVIKKLARSGHSLVLAIPRQMLERWWLVAGDYLKLEDVQEGILVRPLEPRAGARMDGKPKTPKGRGK